MTEYEKEKGCEWKRQYRRRKEAIDAIQDMKKRQGGTQLLEAYNCKYCPFWHVGNNQRKKLKK